MGDLLFNFAEWLRTTPLQGLSDSIDGTVINQAIVSNFWVIPLLQTVHILALAAAFGALLMTMLRIQGWAGAGMTMAETSRRYLPWLRWGMVALLASGLCLILGEPARELLNPIFWIKMALVVALVAIAVVFRKRVLQANTIDGAAKAGSLLLIVLWCVIVLCGRWIAYAPV